MEVELMSITGSKTKSFYTASEEITPSYSFNQEIPKSD
jgi:hypothetical protein